MKAWPIILILFFPTLHLGAQGLLGSSQQGRIDSTKVPALSQHPTEEPDYDYPVDPLRWAGEAGGLHVSFGSTDQAYFRADPPEIPEMKSAWNEMGWRGERLNAMILLWSPDTIRQLRFVYNDLRSAVGNTLSKSQIHLDKIAYVISNYPYGSGDATCGEGSSTQAYLMPDRFISLEGSQDRFDLPARTTRPVWLSIDIPSVAIPGNYAGELEVRSDKGSVKLKIQVSVQSHLLPKPQDWTFRLDLWQNPWVIADYFHVKPWSPAHKLLLAQHLKLYADAGGKYITTYAVHSPWGDNEYYTEGGMIDWIRTASGKWKFDYSIFDDYVNLAIKAGIDKAITIYTPLPWGERFRYREEATGNYVYERWIPGSDSFRNNWNAFLSDLKIHLEKKGWLKIAYLGVNENAMEQTLSAIHVIRDHWKQWRITYAGDWHSELDSLLDDYSSVFNKEPGLAEVGKRQSSHKTSTFYICCTPPKPNTFVFSPPVEGRWLGWYTLAHGYDGFLRWAYDSWTADPNRDPRHVYWPSGDCFMVYPGAASSIRFEKMREGIVDFEKLRLLIQWANGSNRAEIKELREELRSLLNKILQEKAFIPGKISGDLQKGRFLINQLSEKLTAR